MQPETDNILAGKSLLIVEDDAALAAMLQEFFGDLGCNILGPVATAVAALKILETPGIDVALLDVTLQDERSYVVAERLIELDVPFVFATGHKLLPGYATPAAKVLEKPYRPPEVIKAVKAALAAQGEKRDRQAAMAQELAALRGRC